MKKIGITFILILITAAGFSQQKIANFKYVIVPQKLDFFNTADQYQTSSLTQFLFKKYGFISYLNTQELPDDFNNNRCLALFADLKESSSLFVKKITVELKDCTNKVIFTSVLGTSREKNLKRAYNEAIREAFTSIDSLNYVYEPIKQQNNPVVISPQVVVVPKAQIPTVNSNILTLFAQPIKNGFQLVDTSPKVVFVLLKTKQPTVFIIKGKEGIFYKSEAVWIAEFYKEDQLVQQVYQIKF